MISSDVYAIVHSKPFCGYDGGMDVLSDVVSTVRTGRPHSARIEWHAPYGMRFPEVPGARFQVIGLTFCSGLTYGFQCPTRVHPKAP